MNINTLSEKIHSTKFDITIDTCSAMHDGFSQFIKKNKAWFAKAGIRISVSRDVVMELVRKLECENTSGKALRAIALLKDNEDIFDIDIYYGSLLRIIVLTGLRESEALGLTWDSVDFEHGHITIDKQLMRRPQEAGGTVLSSTKSGKPRTLSPAPYVMNLIKIRYAEQQMQQQWAGSEWKAWRSEEEHKKALVFTNDVGEHLVQKRVYLHFKKIANQIGAPDARVHDLRHTFAVLSLQNGDDVKTVQENLGHASASFTLDMYGHVSDRMKKESANRMENFITGLSAQA